MCDTCGCENKATETEVETDAKACCGDDGSCGSCKPEEATAEKTAE